MQPPLQPSIQGRARRPRRSWALAALVAVLVSACGGERPVTVFAAASLADVMEEIAAAWEAAHPELPLELSFAGSSTLARQIAAGAPADLFVSADRAQLLAAERLQYAAAVPIAGNRLVVVGPPEAEELGGPSDLLSVDRLAMADPTAVPAGVYAREWLLREGLWDALRPRVVPTVDVRSALAAVAAGDLPAGIVYQTDATAGGSAERVRVIYRVPVERAPHILYFAAPVVDGAEAGAHPLLDFLTTPAAGEIFRRHGFVHLPAGEPAPPLPAEDDRGRERGSAAGAGS